MQRFAGGFGERAIRFGVGENENCSIIGHTINNLTINLFPNPLDDFLCDVVG